MDEPEIFINNKTFRFVRRSRRGEVAIYISGDFYLRSGSREVIGRMLSLHKKFDSFGFPVPKIIGEGEIKSGAYFIEESLGEECFSFLFGDDFKRDGTVSPELFDKFLSVTEKFARAQLRSATVDHSDDSFNRLIRPSELSEELPELAEKIFARYNEALLALKNFPFVLTHGDFNPHNLFPGGVIDFEETHYGPAGFDLVANIFSNDYFPATPGYEYFRFYSLTREQKDLYYQRLDKIYTEAGLPRISVYKEHLEFFRAVWLTKGNQSMPKLQAWRYELFKRQFFGKSL